MLTSNCSYPIKSKPFNFVFPDFLISILKSGVVLNYKPFNMSLLFAVRNNPLELGEVVGHIQSVIGPEFGPPLIIAGCF